jgi:hypothetical protein
MDEVLARALVRPLVPITWDEESAKLAAAAAAVTEPVVEDDGSGLTAH